MDLTIKIVLLLPCCFLGSICSAQTYPPNDPHWGGTASNNWTPTSIWHDDFSTLPLGAITNATLPFHNNWSYGHGEDSDHGGEPQAYRANNVAVVPDPLGGANCIALTAKREDHYCADCINNPTCVNCYTDHYYTSGQIGSNGPRQIRYGYVEATIRVPDNYGLFPAFWLWTCAPVYNEIDIFEDLPGLKQDKPNQPFHGAYLDRHSVTSNIHYNNDLNDLTACKGPYEDYQVNPIPASLGDYSSAFHKYGLEWTPSKIIYYIDGRVYRNTINPEFSDAAYNTPGKINAAAINIIINLALSFYVRYDTSPTSYDHTKSDGNIDYFEVPTWYTAANPVSVNANGTGEATMYIADVAYYALPATTCNQGTFTINGTFNWANPPSSGYDYDVLNKDVVTNGAINVPAGSANIIRATHSIVINGPFTMSPTARLYLDVNPCY